MTKFRTALVVIASVATMAAGAPAFAMEGPSQIVGEGFPSMRSGYDQPNPSATGAVASAAVGRLQISQIVVGEGFPAVNGKPGEAGTTYRADQRELNGANSAANGREEVVAGVGEGFGPNGAPAPGNTATFETRHASVTGGGTARF